MAKIERMMDGEDLAVVVINGEFDLADEARAELAVDFVLGLEIPLMLVDLTGCPFIDSTALRLLLRAHERALHAGMRMAIGGSQPRVDRIFRLTGVHKRLAIFDTRELALASLRTASADGDGARP